VSGTIDVMLIPLSEVKRREDALLERIRVLEDGCYLGLAVAMFLHRRFADHVAFKWPTKERSEEAHAAELAEMREHHRWLHGRDLGFIPAYSVQHADGTWLGRDEHSFHWTVDPLQRAFFTFRRDAVHHAATVSSEAKVVEVFVRGKEILDV
jgi:hypothetical protein